MKDNVKRTIDFKEAFNIIKNRIWLIITITLLVTACSAIVTYVFMTPKYTTSTQIIVNQKSAQEQLYNTNAVQTNLQLVNTYTTIVNSRPVLNQVIKTMNLKMSVDTLRSKLNVTSEQNSQVFTIYVTDTSPDRAVQIANSVADAAKSQTKKIMQVDNVNTLSKAYLSDIKGPSSPNPKFNILVGFVIGLVISFGFVIFLKYFNNTVSNEEELERATGITVLGAITEINAQDIIRTPKKGAATDKEKRRNRIEA